jgi:class 3 adenylate cyclase
VGLSDDLAAEVRSVLNSRWTTRDGQVVPDSVDIRLGNDGVRLNATVLYADIDGSTSMVDNCFDEFAAEVYKSYLLCAARIIRSEGGVITAYDGDRVMAVFIGGSQNSNAARCGMKIEATVSKIINPLISEQHGGDFRLKQVVGIDSSSLLVARTGIRGSNDLVWVGPAANYAAKLSSLSESPYSTYITKAVFDRLSDSLKIAPDGRAMWEARTWKSKSIYRSKWIWPIPN